MMVVVVEEDVYNVRRAARSVVVPNGEGNVNPTVVHGQELRRVIVIQFKLTLLAYTQVRDRDRLITPIHGYVVICLKQVEK